MLSLTKRKLDQVKLLRSKRLWSSRHHNKMRVCHHMHVLTVECTVFKLWYSVRMRTAKSGSAMQKDRRSTAVISICIKPSQSMQECRSTRSLKQRLPDLSATYASAITCLCWAILAQRRRLKSLSCAMGPVCTSSECRVVVVLGRP